MKMRELTEQDVTFTVECFEEDIPFVGNCSASDDEEMDRAAEQWIREQLENGNEWAWCRIVVRCEWKGWHTESHLGGCSYLSKEDFITGGYYDDMKRECLDALNQQIQDAIEDLVAQVKDE